MKLTHKQRQIIALCCAVILILIGLVQAIFNVKIDQQVADDISFVLVVIAAGVLFGGKGKKKKTEEEKKEENITKDEIEEKNTPDN